MVILKVLKFNRFSSKLLALKLIQQGCLQLLLHNSTYTTFLPTVYQKLKNANAKSTGRIVEHVSDWTVLTKFILKGKNAVMHLVNESQACLITAQMLMTK